MLVARNKGRPGLRKITSLHIAKVEDVYKGHSKLSKKTGNKLIYCNVLMDNGTTYKDVPVYGGTVDVDTGNLHGMFIPPVVGQMVGIIFVQGHYENPMCCFSIPFPWLQQKDGEKFHTKIDEEILNIKDGGIFHRSGSRIYFKDDGTIEIKNHDESATAIMKTDGTITVSGAAIELNGNADFAVAFNDLKTAFDSLKQTVNTHTHLYSPGPLPQVATATGLPQATADMAGAKVDDVKLP